MTLRNPFKQPIGLVKFIFAITIIDMILYHLPLYNFAIDKLNIYSLNGLLTFFSVLVGLFTVTAFLLFLIALILPKMMKGFAIVIFICNSVALYFVNTYSVIIDRSMMGNVFNTNTAEALSYYDSKVFIYIVFLGIIPSLFISKITIKISKRFRLFIMAFVTLAVGVFIMYLNATTWLWLDKYAKYLGGMTMPWSYSINAIRHQAREFKKSKIQILLPDAKIQNNNKMVVVLIIGESARAKNFSLYGYKRETNPKLKEQDIITLKNSTSTTTYTTASVNSMLSPTGSTSDSHEPLTSFLQRTGVDVIWRANNWGAPKMSIKSYEKAGELRKSCKGIGCDYDEVLLANLNKKILNSDKNKVFVVLHTEGSHGPTYYKKYPKGFDFFKPVCKSVDLKECTNKELINAYDNTILYTDYFLSRAIDELKELKDTPVLFIYASDHGESLGEYGLYLHGTPYAIAPDVQKDIPFIIWESKSFLKDRKFTKPYVRVQKSYGHYNIFHTVLGAFDINSTLYNKKLDLLQND